MNTKKNILFYGTCQSLAVKTILNLNDNYFNQFHVQCYSTDITKNDFDNILKDCDIIITQPIPDNYREKEYLSTDYIINNCKKDCITIIYQRQYFNFYYFDSTYKNFNNSVLHQPNDYHYNELINYYKNNLSINSYIDNIINNVNFKSKQELEIIADESIQYLIQKDKHIVDKYVINNNIHYISIANYIRNNYKKELLFFSMNHPTKKLLQPICKKILQILNIDDTINYNIDPLNSPRCILYKCIENVIDFKISNDNIILNDKTNLTDIIQLYYDTYKNIQF